MTRALIELERTRISETEIIDIAFDFLLDGRTVADCRGYVLGEYDIDSDDLRPLLQKAMDQVEELKKEVSKHLRF